MIIFQKSKDQSVQDSVYAYFKLAAASKLVLVDY